MWNPDWKLIRNFIRTSLKKRWFLRIGQLIKSTPQFHTDNLSSTHRFHTWTTRFHEISAAKNPSVPPLPLLFFVWGMCWTERSLVWKWGVYWPERFLVRNWRVLVWNWEVCWTEGFLVWYWGIFEAEKGWLFCVELMCWTEGGVELRGAYMLHITPCHWLSTIKDRNAFRVRSLTL